MQDSALYTAHPGSLKVLKAVGRLHAGIKHINDTSIATLLSVPADLRPVQQDKDWSRWIPGVRKMSEEEWSDYQQRQKEKMQDK